ncbi:hypothetical protein [Defluviimonas salinarum]|uniref:DUF2283 domain-containing protein n=1 Tax=Defluviimonas salinarum TaxID=2992147 RepID=A0ABT3J4C6_9RHOB|nr:hypothetical protein [Defluviimonas salinarum]MCW3782523.1 hypothetical protein [Defluviimonas salinarum]
MRMPHCAVFRRDTISYVIVLPEDIPEGGFPVHLRADVRVDEDAVRMEFIDRPGEGIQVDREAEADLRDSMRLFIFVSDPASRGLVAEILPVWA